MLNTTQHHEYASIILERLHLQLELISLSRHFEIVMEAGDADELERLGIQLDAIGAYMAELNAWGASLTSGDRPHQPAQPGNS
jgi:hypothetical protein